MTKEIIVMICAEKNQQPTKYTLNNSYKILFLLNRKHTTLCLSDRKKTRFPKSQRKTLVSVTQPET